MRILLLSIIAATLTFQARAAEKDLTVKVEGKPAFHMNVPEDAQIRVDGPKTTVLGKKTQIYIWELPKAKSVADVVPNVGDVIKTEFVKFTVKSTNTVKVAGHEAKQIRGTGEEADDNDPGSAEVVIFTAGKHVFAACVHGEHDAAAVQSPELLKALGSIKVE